MFKGAVNISENIISGWCVGDHDNPISLNIIINGINIRKIFSNAISSEHEGKRCGFHFEAGRDLLKLLPPNSSVEILVDNKHPLQFTEGSPNVIHGYGEMNNNDLIGLFEKGYVVDKWGELKLPFGADPTKKKSLLDLYTRVRNLLFLKNELLAYVWYGTLLGCVRESDLLNHDDDIDATFIIKTNSLEALVEEFYSVVEFLITNSYKSNLKITILETGQIQIWSDSDHMDLFVTWINPENQIYTYFGVLGSLDFGAEITPINKHLYGNDLLIPSYAEKILEFTYGLKWKVPDPFFQYFVSEEVEDINNKFRLLGREKFTKYSAILEKLE
jgi:hypothetical protein